jgi:TPR repeat protein
MLIPRTLLSLLLFAGASIGQAEAPAKIENEFGILNPEDTGVAMLKRKIEMGVIDSVTCSLGINATKNSDHGLSRNLTRLCAEAGYTKAMTWMSQLDNNGLGAEFDPDTAARWDKRAADAGDRVGKFNHGLNLLRGHGIARDETLGWRYVDEAAKEGLPAAKRLRRADYDVDEVTPDADNWKYAPLF